MRFLAVLVLVVFLSACVWDVKEHDPSLASAYIETKLQINILDCETRVDQEAVWAQTAKTVRFMTEYAAFRTDPQIDSVRAVEVYLQNAEAASSSEVCEHWLKLLKIRMQVINQAWRGR